MSTLNYKDFDVNKMGLKEVNRKEVNTPNGRLTMWYVKLEYNYGSQKGGVYFEGPPMVCSGINARASDHNGRTSYSVMFMPDTNHQRAESSLPGDDTDFIMANEQTDVIECIDNIYFRARHILYDNRSEVRPAWMQHYDPERPMGHLKSPLWRNPEAPNKDPSMWTNLYYFVKDDGSVSKSTFVGLDKKPIDWSVITGKNIRMTVVPRFKVDHVFIGANSKVQFSLASAVVLDVSERSEANAQEETLMRILEDNPMLKDKLAAKLAHLHTSNQEEMLNRDLGSEEERGGQGGQHGQLSEMDDITAHLEGRQPSSPQTHQQQPPRHGQQQQHQPQHQPERQEQPYVPQPHIPSPHVPSPEDSHEDLSQTSPGPAAYPGISRPTQVARPTTQLRIPTRPAANVTNIS